MATVPASCCVGRLLAAGLLLSLGVASTKLQGSELPWCPNVLIVNSYAPGYLWSDDEMSGVTTSLKRHFRGVDPVVEFLDTKKFALEPRETALVSGLAAKIAKRPPRVIITLDDAAFFFVLKNRSALGPQTPVVFGGLNHFEPSMLADVQGVTGISEESDFHHTLDLLRHLVPETRHLVVVNTTTESGRASRRSFETILPEVNQTHSVEFFENWTNDELFGKLAGLTRKDAVLLLDTTVDSRGHANHDDATFAEALAQRSARPVFLNYKTPGNSHWSTETWPGVGGGLIDAEYHGEAVGEMATRLLRGEDISQIPVVPHSPSVTSVDFRQLKHFGIPLGALPDGVIVYNEPDDFYRINRTRIILAAIAFVGLVSIIAALLIALRQRKRVERALRAAQADLELLASAMSQASDVILVLDEAGLVRYANGAYERITGNSTASVRGRHFDTLFNARGTRHPFTDIHRTLNARGSWRSTFEHVSNGAQSTLLQVSITPLRTDQGTISHTLFVGRDVTLESKLQTQLLSSQKMEAVGMLAGGIAHDFNNILQIIRGECSMVGEDTSLGEALASLKLIDGAARRATQLTQQLLVFSRRQVMTKTVLNPTAVVSEWLKILERLIGEHISVTFSPLEITARIFADRGQLEQVLLNLCVNARDAMPAGGTLTISLRLTRFTDEKTAPPDAAIGKDYVCITVSDTGCGMPPEVAARVFEPFFTTKSVGQGTGLGLSVVYGIVQQHHGFIELRTALGSGTTFEVHLPVTNENDEHSQAATHEGQERGEGIILLAEDDDHVRDIATRMLERSGFQVITAHDGLQAMDFVEKHHLQIRLVILDVLMPGANGPSVCEYVKANYPSIPVLYCSGYSSELLPTGVTPGKGIEYLNKPYSMEELLTTVHRLLAKP